MWFLPTLTEYLCCREGRNVVALLVFCRWGHRGSSFPAIYYKCSIQRYQSFSNLLSIVFHVHVCLDQPAERYRFEYEIVSTVTVPRYPSCATIWICKCQCINTSSLKPFTTTLWYLALAATSLITCTTALSQLWFHALALLFWRQIPTLTLELDRASVAAPAIPRQ